MGQLATDPHQLAAVINLYASHPDRRHAIGTPDELTRLHTDLDKPGVAGAPDGRRKPVGADR